MQFQETQIINVGDRFGRLVVVAFSHKRDGRKYFLCRCDCGTEKTVGKGDLYTGDAKSCGCLRKETLRRLRIKHGMSCKADGARRAPEYNIWSHMKRRCLSPSNAKYMDYGGRGIKVCDRWLKFENFIADMGLRPTPQHSINRIDNNGDYCPEKLRMGHSDTAEQQFTP